MEASRIPVIVGVGQVNDRDETLNSLELMEAAMRAAERDAGGSWLAHLDSLGVVDQISFRELGNVSGPLAERLGAAPRLCRQTPIASGDSPILLLNEAANAIVSGEITVAAVVGGEALRTAAKRAAAGARATTAAPASTATPAIADSRATTATPPSAGGRPNLIGDAAASWTTAYRQRFGLATPTDVYPLYENAGRAAYGQTLAEGQAESAAIWSRFSEVAAGNPAAWLRKRVDEAIIATPSPSNRPISFPYTKFMVANASVNQGAGFIVTSLRAALDAGLSETRLVYVGAGAAAHEDEDFLARDSYARSVSLEVSLRRALDFNGLETQDLDYVELYSCFPCVPKMARRAIGWPLDRPATVFGGLTFGGGPIGNYMTHAVASMVDALRSSGRFGLLFANGGYATHNHSIVLSRSVPADAVLGRDFNVQAEADGLRGPVPALDERYAGPGTIESYTIHFTRDGAPRFGVVLVRTSGGTRTLARVPADDEAGIARLAAGDAALIGAAGTVVGQGVDALWRF
jgi:acetyl-CoA C-acetyltransferase